MIRHSPCEVYIKYLLSHVGGYSDEDVIQMLRLKQLDFIGPSYLQRLRADMRVPATFRPHDRRHRPSANFLATNQLYYLYHPDEPMEEARKVLNSPRAKEAVETMLITDDPSALIAHRMATLGTTCSIDGVNRYRFFFFNPYLVDETEMRALLRLRAEFRHQDDDEYEEQVRFAMKKAAYRDPRRAAADCSMRDASSVLNQLRMGFLPSQFDLAKMLRATSIAATTQSYVFSHLGGKSDGASARDYAMTAKMMQEMQSELGAPEADLYKELQTFTLKTEAIEVPHIKQLTDGSYTTDVQPVGLTKEVVDGE